MNIEDIRQLAKDLSQSGLSSVEVERPGFRLNLKRGAAPQASPLSVERTEAEPDSVTLDITSTGVGCFLDAHPDNGIVLAPLGSDVHVGQLVALLAIGNLILPVRSPYAGQVSHRLAETDTTVGYGQPLICLSPYASEAEQP